MRAESTVKPPMSLKFTIEETDNGKCNVHLYENIEEHTNEDGDIIYTYNVYVLEGIPYHENLKTNIKAKKSRWLDTAKKQEMTQRNKMAIAKLKKELAEYDYIGVKIATGVATVDAYAQQIAHCENLRRQIRELEQ